MIGNKTMNTETEEEGCIYCGFDCQSSCDVYERRDELERAKHIIDTFVALLPAMRYDEHAKQLIENHWRRTIANQIKVEVEKSETMHEFAEFLDSPLSDELIKKI